MMNDFIGDFMLFCVFIFYPTGSIKWIIYILIVKKLTFKVFGLVIATNKTNFRKHTFPCAEKKK